jgi:hypothetical protein
LELVLACLELVLQLEPALVYLELVLELVFPELAGLELELADLVLVFLEQVDLVPLLVQADLEPLLALVFQELGLDLAALVLLVHHLLEQPD